VTVAWSIAFVFVVVTSSSCLSSGVSFFLHGNLQQSAGSRAFGTIANLRRARAGLPTHALLASQSETGTTTEASPGVVVSDKETGLKHPRYPGLGQDTQQPGDFGLTTQTQASQEQTAQEDVLSETVVGAIREDVPMTANHGNKRKTWVIFGAFVSVAAAAVNILYWLQRRGIQPVIGYLARLFGVQKSKPKPRFRASGEHVASANELGIELEGMKGPVRKNVPDYPVNPSVNIRAITAPVLLDLVELRENLTALVGASNPRLIQVAKQIFGSGGKRLRPVIVFLVARATAVASGMDQLTPQQRRLAEVIEMIHTASLLHDDVVDDSDTRRGSASVHQTFGTGVAVLAGDYMFAQSSWYLACMENLTVIKLISRVIADFADGEVAQAGNLYNPSITMDDYLVKSFNKTATLIAASCKSAAVFSGVIPSMCDDMYNYGKHLGLAFQVVDDILDFTQDSETLGKPAGSDLASGNVTAPTLYAMRKNPELAAMISSKFKEEGSLERAIEIVKNGEGIAEAQKLAKFHGNLAKASLEALPESPYKTSLEMMVDHILSRIY
jgi:all-trans-nonaprenyl-diphosphate synthase